jgi:hypothetical protein
MSALTDKLGHWHSIGPKWAPSVNSSGESRCQASENDALHNEMIGVKLRFRCSLLGGAAAGFFDALSCF